MSTLDDLEQIDANVAITYPRLRELGYKSMRAYQMVKVDAEVHVSKVASFTFTSSFRSVIGILWLLWALSHSKIKLLNLLPYPVREASPKFVSAPLGLGPLSRVARAQDQVSSK